MLFRCRTLLTTVIAVACLICSHGFALGQRWPDEHRDPPFNYHADFQLQPFHSLLRSVTDLQHEVPQLLGLQPLDEPVHVFLFERQRTYQTYVTKYFPTVPNRPALFIKQRGPGMVFARLSNNLAVDLRHETTHAVLHGILPMVPLWLDEGLGEYFEVPATDRANQNPHLAEVQKLARRGVVPRIEDLEKLAELSQMRAEHYRDAWAWVHFMLHGPPEGRKVLVSFLRDVESSIPPGQMSSRLRSQLTALDAAFLEHFTRTRR